MKKIIVIFIILILSIILVSCNSSNRILDQITFDVSTITNITVYVDDQTILTYDDQNSIEPYGASINLFLATHEYERFLTDYLWFDPSYGDGDLNWDQYVVIRSTERDIYILEFIYEIEDETIHMTFILDEDLDVYGITDIELYNQIMLIFK